MDTFKEPKAWGFSCITEGCSRQSRAKTKPGLCHACQSKESYHRKNPNAPRFSLGHHGKWKNVFCKCGEPVSAKGLCIKCYREQYRSPKPTSEENRARRIKHRYGITQEQYDQMVAERGNKCDVCGEPPSDKNTRAHWNAKLCIDHDHKTGKVRGLLCNDCNLAVGYGKTPAILESAGRYLRLHCGSNC